MCNWNSSLWIEHVSRVLLISGPKFWVDRGPPGNTHIYTVKHSPIHMIFSPLMVWPVFLQNSQQSQHMNQSNSHQGMYSPSQASAVRELAGMHVSFWCPQQQHYLLSWFCMFHSPPRQVLKNPSYPEAMHLMSRSMQAQYHRRRPVQLAADAMEHAFETAARSQSRIDESHLSTIHLWALDLLFAAGTCMSAACFILGKLSSIIMLNGKSKRAGDKYFQRSPADKKRI